MRDYGLPVNETLVVAPYPGGLFVDALPSALSYIFSYFEGNNDERLNLLKARTVPITVRPPTNNGTNGAWVVSLMVSTAQYPDSFKIPTPLSSCTLEPVGRHLFATLAFNTTSFPEMPDFEEACGAITAGPLPTGYTVVNSSWTPTWVLYNSQASKFWTNECWVEVEKA